MNYAIIEASGKQLFVKPGQFYDVNYISAQPGDIIRFNRVLLLRQESKILVGNPCLSSIKVRAKVLKHIKAKKITVFKMKRKKNVKVKQGHRQKMTRVLVENIVNI